MAESKHTPGPWKISNVISAYEIKRRKIIAAEQSPEAGTGICEVYGIEDGNNIANAKLIAAAPELLEACRLVLNAIEQADLGGDVLWIKRGSPVHESATERLQNVIKLATGEKVV